MGGRTSRVSEALQVLEDPETGLAVRHGDIHIMLLPVLVDRKALERQHAAGPKLRLHRARDEDGTLHLERLDSSLHQRELERDDAGHLYRAAEGYFTVALAEVEVAHGELGARDVYREVCFAPAREVLDVAVSAVLGAARDRAGAFGADFGFECTRGCAGVDVFGLGEVGDDTVESVEFYELGLTACPFGEDLGGWSTAHDTWVDEAGETHMRDVA